MFCKCSFSFRIPFLFYQVYRSTRVKNVSKLNTQSNNQESKVESANGKPVRDVFPS